MPEYFALIQARIGSTRCPGKVLRYLKSKTLLENVLFGLPESNTVLCIPDNSENQVLADFIQKRGYAFVRGDEKNVLQRFKKAIDVHIADKYLRITADNPCIYRPVIPILIKALDHSDYVISSELPNGGAIEGFTRQAFLRMCNLDLQAAHFEHVTPAFYTDPAFSMQKLECGYGHLKDLRLTVDTEDDFGFMQALADRYNMEPCQIEFSDLSRDYAIDPVFFTQNAHIKQKTWQDVS